MEILEIFPHVNHQTSHQQRFIRIYIYILSSGCLDPAWFGMVWVSIKVSTISVPTGEQMQVNNMKKRVNTLPETNIAPKNDGFQ